MAAPQLPLFTNDAAGIVNLNTVVAFINRLWLFVWSFVSNPDNLAVISGGPVNVAPDQSVLISRNTSAPLTYNLPLLPYKNEKHTFKDGDGSAGIYNITIQGGGINIDGQPSFVINVPFQAYTVVYDGVGWDVIA